MFNNHSTNNLHPNLPWDGLVLSWFNESMNDKNKVFYDKSRSLLSHLPDFNYSIYDPFASYSNATINSPYGSSSSCSEGIPTNDYFGACSEASSPVLVPTFDEELYTFSDVPKKHIKKPKAKIEKKKHNKNKVSEEKAFLCEFKECGKLFGRQEHVKRHMRSIHTQERPYVCPYSSCQKKFARSDNLNQHIRTHRKTGKDL
ncbi:hypothetical protein G6F47_003366 [Rhizopus delemar]|uniref:C2H2-type domain-containing protein n=1 Tax=Rhizopus delemar (strain RA 99-880 / ATCC MYA-4621 / FGSC 9543 / NRRL 43880) TaxID=246409 RepID=I1C1I1_RHIO9|nr:hypothetical protein RO3G_07016 [Rhizopus delemar RA 99-880]KAG1488729.1 hypothetical protein G6F54_011916 [Rhizopus delemar]KAG1511364.1 hypothetical protein G6F53_005993 [Rhizopus delemar]KAG1558045.1 hypothetical protein G6F49_004844 [Rhizopus delemar]KAG1592043.1 hypothetical protein G6F48_002906 [Rhizopus delemar]|eukprot:EIE82311.1 hypothetical protein RO3G_07016 [Rhizopus delemar RA 99-880]